MATLDRQIPSPDTCLLEPWSSFVGAAKLRFVDSADSPLDNGDKEHYCPGEDVKPSKEEMLLCSQFPALDDFYLVVCRVCNKVVTPQGILTHYASLLLVACCVSGAHDERVMLLLVVGVSAFLY
uniref:Uncharacterized protein n=1 Tax=Anabas testudineus TaxID=64144 RepID=A0AAQ6IBX2_ANATE